MWLINTQTLALEYFASPKKVPYAILSHTWEQEEVTFQEFHKLDTARSRKGFAKIAKTCSVAKDRGLEYAWVDTCCINKENSAELSEAINSMFRWYKNATVCLVFLSDLAQGHDGGWASCRWFTRGWTLQELIAPPNVEFYDAAWTFKGTKKGLLGLLSWVTGIDETVLSGETRLSELPVARKMSWAARRRTGRDEDIAYCLMGLFDLNMPLLYGEGQKAFLRLQEQILNQTHDLSLLAWTAQDEPHPYEDYEDGDDPHQQFRGIFASSPVEFSACGGIVSRLYPCWTSKSEEFTVTSKAWRSNSPLVYEVQLLEEVGTLGIEPEQIMGNGTPENFVLSLRCIKSGTVDNMCKFLTMVILLRQTSEGYVRTRFRKTSARSTAEACGFPKPTETNFDAPELLQVFVPPEVYDPVNNVFRLDGGPGNAHIGLNFNVSNDSPLSQRNSSNQPRNFKFLLAARHLGDAGTSGDRDPRLAFSWAIVPETSDWYDPMLLFLKGPRQRAIDNINKISLSFFQQPLPTRVELKWKGAKFGELLLDVVRVPMQEFRLVDRPAEDDYLYSIQLGWKPWVPPRAGSFVPKRR
ncbi:hypothetical protein PpBr36_07504 [Pyricularia pennisetigena]|uniref:hypothetical protein n=1 Tax=Pyricularia pennisetigena TaxID=1578925 RepID=UPI001152058B|nr:hypothetical protein PpBr36_07504 [Pyricularia pennisetigena]TLS24954.1 hypothetical protein PpBr36_07504 [Pyricularia pennisetigena]